MLFHQLLEASERHNLPERQYGQLLSGTWRRELLSLIN